MEYLRVAESTPNGVDSLRTGPRVACRTGVEVGPRFAVPIRRLLGFSQSRRAPHTGFRGRVLCVLAVRLDPSILCVFCILGLLHAAVVDVARVLLWCWWCLVVLVV